MINFIYINSKEIKGYKVIIDFSSLQKSTHLQFQNDTKFYRFVLPPYLTLKNFEGLDLGKMDKVSKVILIIEFDFEVFFFYILILTCYGA